MSVVELEERRPLMTVAEAAELLGEPKRRVETLVARGVISSFKIGACRRLDPFSVDRYGGIEPEPKPRPKPPKLEAEPAARSGRPWLDGVARHYRSILPMLLWMAGR